ncbi:MAG: TonB-dependent receptor [Acinetobacter populi]|jgi:vitamin B12 transporter|uniref:TonB-dependent receptor plug domain-containing protein n=1 Tax=Acinetobacter populi TaxID=1582270 RepID=UPI002353C1AD|nr:TonB-dependent receptor [Acinetobacter populi]MCH4246907.1 TonB-dependent receptor [Acinetobacter populi]
MSKHFQPASLAGAIAIVLTSTTTFAADQTIELDPIVVTASKSEEKASEVPARISVINEQTLTQSPIAALPSLLQQEAAINMVQSGGYGQISSIFLRGSNSNQTLVLRDGIRLNTISTGAANIAFIDTTDLKQIEILKGPASVLYGTDAIGGVIQLISKTPEKTSAFITTEAGEKSTYKAVIGADLVEDGFYAQIRGQRLETDGTRVTDFNQSNLKTADYDQKGFSTKIGIEQKEYAISLDYNQNQGTTGYIDCNLSNLDYSCGGLKNVSQDFKNEAINLKSRINVAQNWDVNLRLSQFKDDLNQNDANWDGSYDYIQSKTKEADLNAKWQFTPEQNILMGITRQNIEGDVVSYATPYNGDVDSTGYYLQHQYQQPGLNTQLGLRVEDNEKYGTHTVGQGAIRFHVLPLTSIYANIGTAFKSPTLNQLYSSYGNVDLKPEESTSYEIGLDQKLNYGLTAGLSLYHTKVKDLIDYASSAPYYFSNVSKATFQGGESYIAWQNEGWFSKAAYNYVKTENDETHTELNRRPRQSFTLTAGIENEVYGVSASLSAKSSAKDYQQNTPGYVTVNVNTYWNVHPNVKLFANVENLADVEYKTASYQAGTYYINGGRLATAGVTLRY